MHLFSHCTEEHEPIHPSPPILLPPFIPTSGFFFLQSDPLKTQNRWYHPEQNPVLKREQSCLFIPSDGPALPLYSCYNPVNPLLFLVSWIYQFFSYFRNFNYSINPIRIIFSLLSLTSLLYLYTRCYIHVCHSASVEVKGHLRELALSYHVSTGD